MKCPVCGAAELIHDTCDLPYTYKGETRLFRQYPAISAPVYAESILDAAGSDRAIRG